MIITSARSTMPDNRSSNLSLLVVERDFSMHYNKFNDTFGIQCKKNPIHGFRRKFFHLVLLKDLISLMLYCNLVFILN